MNTTMNPRPKSLCTRIKDAHSAKQARASQFRQEERQRLQESFCKMLESTLDICPAKATEAILFTAAMEMPTAEVEALNFEFFSSDDEEYINFLWCDKKHRISGIEDIASVLYDRKPVIDPQPQPAPGEKATPSTPTGPHDGISIYIEQDKGAIMRVVCSSPATVYHVYTDYQSKEGAEDHYSGEIFPAGIGIPPTLHAEALQTGDCE